MARLLLLLVLGLILWRWWAARGASTPAPSEREASELAGPEPLVVCRRCGTHIPRSQALPAAEGDGWVCGHASHCSVVASKAEP